ncbi:hypothetical protein BDP27DRAFT_305619 [Rhodocollybia butyracea]|uniref:Uncharacterized protein n=1 Tax=Rhodocollybia butyracea TaxID=206335 RepID=A0A9P5PG96_9AGAR|nr:hypothetical protein BDP27DRAFT_305619 [Rhodocollybia butyracea]
MTNSSISCHTQNGRLPDGVTLRNDFASVFIPHVLTQDIVLVVTVTDLDALFKLLQITNPLLRRLPLGSVSFVRHWLCCLGLPTWDRLQHLLVWIRDNQGCGTVVVPILSQRWTIHRLYGTEIAFVLCLVYDSLPKLLKCPIAVFLVTDDDS